MCASEIVEYGHEPRSEGCQIVSLLDLLATSLSHLVSEFAIADEIDDPVGHPLGVIGFEHKASCSVLNNTSRVSSRSGEHWQAGSHGFQYHVGKSFVFRAGHQQTRVSQ